MALLVRLGCLSLHRQALRVPSVTVMAQRAKQSKSSYDLAKEFRNIRSSDILDSEACQDILSRTRVVTECDESVSVVSGLISAGSPVGLDMEGVAFTNQRTSLIQVSDMAGNITLFRTGVNPDLYSRGGLADLLQSQTVLKVIHAATCDSLSIYRDSVKMWNIYDTSVAHNVLDFQRTGCNLYSANSVSFNNLCRKYGMPENPLKDMFKNILWKMEVTKDGAFGLDNPNPLRDELIVYCAWDVDPLLSLYETLQREISPCYHPLVTQMSEIEILRAIDPGLAKAKRKNIKTLATLSLFLSNLPPQTSPADLYISLAGQISGYKHVDLSQQSRTATILLDSREAAVTAVKEYHKWATADMKVQHTHCQLIVENFSNEVFAGDNGESGETETGDEDVESAIYSGQIKTVVALDVDGCRDVVSALLGTNSPVLVDFSLYSSEGEERLGAELYLGTMPSYKLVLSPRMLTSGHLASLFSGDSVKIVNRMDSEAVQSAISFLFKNDVNVRNVFDLSMAVRSLDFFEYGQSWFQQPMPSSRNIGKLLGLSLDPKTSKQHKSYLAYLQLKRKIPTKIQSLLDTFVELDIISAAQTTESLKAKAKKSEMKQVLENKYVHIRLQGKSGLQFKTDSRVKLKELVYSYNDVVTSLTNEEEKSGIIRDYSEFGRSVLVETSSIHRVAQLVHFLEQQQSRTDLKYIVSNTSFKKTLEKPKTTTNLGTLELSLRENIKNLANAGLQISYPEDSCLPY